MYEMEMRSKEQIRRLEAENEALRLASSKKKKRFSFFGRKKTAKPSKDANVAQVPVTPIPNAQNRRRADLAPPQQSLGRTVSTTSI